MKVLKKFILDWSEVEVLEVVSQLDVTGSLFQLTVGLVSQVLDFSIKTKGLLRLIKEKYGYVNHFISPQLKVVSKLLIRLSR